MDLEEYFRHQAFLGFTDTSLATFTHHYYTENEGAPKPSLRPSVLMNKQFINFSY